MIKKILCTSFVLCLFWNLLADQNQKYQEASKNFYRLFAEESFYKYEHNWLNTIKQFQNIYKSYPKSVQAAKSLYNIGNLYATLYLWNTKTEHLKNSSEYFKKLYEQYPTNYLADDALFLLSQNYQKTNTNLQKKYLQILLQKYPKSNFIKDAQKILTSTTLQKPKTTSKKKQTAIAKEDKNFQISGQSKKVPEIVSKAQIKDLDYFTTASWTRVIVTTEKKLPYKYQALQSDKKLEIPPRFYIDIIGGILPANFAKKRVSNNGIIRRLRISQFNPQTTRLVLDLYTLTEIKVFSVNINKENKIIIDIFGQEQEPEWKKILSELDLEKSVNKNINLKNALGLKVNRIILDPGHGGKDPGAVHGKNHYEKIVVLKIAQILKKKLQASLPKTQILLTRKIDSAIALEKRTAFANSQKGDLFISIHVNSFTNSKIQGIETYYLNLTTNERALKLSARENSSSSKNVSDLQNILNELVNHTKIPESKKLAQNVQNAIVKELSAYKAKNLGVKKAPFLVLIGTQMPSILVEVGFISNPTERARLSQTSYLQKLAAGIEKGIIHYIRSI